MPVGTAHIIADTLKDSASTAFKSKRKGNIYLLQSKDPTRTITLRRRFVADSDRRYNALSKVIKESIVDNDCFGLKENIIPFPSQSMIKDLNAIPSQAFKYMRDDQKVDAFMNWLEEQEEKGILEIRTGPGIENEPWSNIYVRSAYQKGLAKSQAELAGAGVSVGTAQGAIAINPVSFAFYQPIHTERVALIYTRIFRQLKGVSKAMEGQISRELALGLASGEGVEAVAKRIDDRVKKIGRTRARLIARTETVQTHNEGKLNEYERMEGAIGETIYVQWWSALDERVRDSHGPHVGRHGKVYTRKEARGLLGEPNCRCTLLSYIESIDGPKRSARKRAIEEDGTGDVPTPKQRKSKGYKKEQEEKERQRREKARDIRRRIREENK